MLEKKQVFVCLFWGACEKQHSTHFSLFEDDFGAAGFPLPSTEVMLALALIGLNWT